MPEYEYRSKSSTGDMKLGSILNVESDALAKAHGGMAFATFLGFRQFGALASRQASRRGGGAPDPAWRNEHEGILSEASRIRLRHELAKR